MPGTVKVKVVAARNLPVMDRATFLTDAFVEVKLGNVTFKTEVVRRSLNPIWNCDWLKFELDDQELQEEALQVRVLDHDTYSSHDAIGRVYLDLNPLLVKSNNRAVNGWFPIYDTMHGIRGEINLIVRVEIFSDASRFRQSSVGVRFFYSTCIPHGYRLQTILGFVEELLINDDPEYQLIEKIRTSRASNEARQRLFSKINGELQRKLGVKVLEMGGNSVIGYQLHFDLEGETGIVVRGIGTAASLIHIGLKVTTPPPSPHLSKDTLQFEHSDPESPMSTSPVEETKGFAKSFRVPMAPLKSTKSKECVEFPFLTICQPPAGFVLHYGSVISAKSVKLLDKIPDSEEEDTRNNWWLELRTEVRCHMKTMGCTSVLGYREESAICDEVIVLSAYGTAVILNPLYDASSNGFNSCEEQNPSNIECSTSPAPPNQLAYSMDRPLFERERSRVPSYNVHAGTTQTADSSVNILIPDVNASNLGPSISPISTSMEWGPPLTSRPAACTLCHVPYSESVVPYRISLARCLLCQKSYVPDTLFSTTDLPEEMPMLGKPALLQARVVRPKRETKGEASAKEISDSLPFIEYDIHQKLMQKLKLNGMNALFGLRIRITIGESIILALGQATGVYALALPAPLPPRLNKNSTMLYNNEELERLQQDIQNRMNVNKEFYLLTALQEMYNQRDECITGSVNENESTIGVSLDQNCMSASPGSPLNPASEELDMSSPKDELIVVESEDFGAEELIALVTETLPPPNMSLATTNRLPPQPSTNQDSEDCSPNQNGYHPVNRLNSLTVSSVNQSSCAAIQKQRPMQNFIRLCRLPGDISSNEHLSKLMTDFDHSTLFKFRKMAPCSLTTMDCRLSFTDDGDILALATGMCVSEAEALTTFLQNNSGQPLSDQPQIDNNQEPHNLSSKLNKLTRQNTVSGVSRGSISGVSTMTDFSLSNTQNCLLTPLNFIPDAHVENYLGNVDFFFVRETTSVRDYGGVSGFVHSCLSEVQAVVCAHTLSLGGNAVLSFHLSEVQLVGRNQAQVLLNVCGDMVKMSPALPIQSIAET